MTYEEWMRQVDQIVEKRCGLGQSWLPDWLSRDAYESGMTPEQGASECLTIAEWEADDKNLLDEM